jgi:hypothetical protein
LWEPGYGGNGIAASASNASISLLQSAANTAQDANSADATYLDYYATTDSSGAFSITGDYSCTPGQQVYLYGLSGNPTYPSGTANSAIGLMAALGACPSTDSFPSSTYVVVNEVSTVAAAYAFAGFASDAVHVGSSGTALAQVGIANAFANAGNLETLGTGVALAVTPAGNGTVPQATINTLADILAACVNTNAPGSSGCSTLFANAMSAGSTGTVATDTATAAINIAHNPGANIGALYGLVTANPPFAQPLSAQPNDFTLGLKFAGGGLSTPNGIAIDGSGDAWLSNYGGNSVTKLSSLGAVLSGASGYTGGGLNQPIAIAVDGSGNAWIADDPNSTTTGEVTRISSGSSPTINGYTVGGLMGPYGIAIDATGGVWVPNGDNGSVTKLTGSGTARGELAVYGWGLE